MAKLLRANDALENAIDSNNGLEALVELMGSARDVDAPNLKHLADLVSIVQKDIAASLEDIQRCIKD